MEVAIITGAAKGIGKGIALRLADEGYEVVVSDLDDKGIKEVVKEIEAKGQKALGVKADVSKHKDAQKILKKAQDIGEVKVLVNNAGIYPFKPFMEMDEKAWDNVMDVNLKGVFFLSQEAAKVMDGGRIINVSSIASIMGFKGLVHYCASKGGVNGFTRGLALELAEKNITVNAILPGAIETPGATGVLDEETKKQMIAQVPLARYGTPEDIAEAVVFFIKADYVTGQTIVVDGGWTIA